MKLAVRKSFTTHLRAHDAGEMPAAISLKTCLRACRRRRTIASKWHDPDVATALFHLLFQNFHDVVCSFTVSDASNIPQTFWHGAARIWLDFWARIGGSRRFVLGREEGSTGEGSRKVLG